MVITKELEEEVTTFMNNYWTTYLEGDIETWSSYLTDDYKNIGGTEEEIWNSKSEIIDYTLKIIDQMIGSAGLRNTRTQVFSLSPYILAHEFTDMYIKVEDDWVFYGKFRLSSILQRSDNGFQVVHQHGSYPDSKTEPGEAFAFDKIRTENKELRDAVKRRTIELENKTIELEKAMANLQTTQDQLIHSEKMASLGELTAGIAHEIQNPLNFVNNFSDLNRELIDDQLDELDKGEIEEAKTIAKDIKENESKINHHGHRASDIVKSMLEHSRSGDGKKEPTDINKLADEYLRLAYHGIRAKDKSFNADFELDLDESLHKLNVVPQDIGRVLLNLINNAFYVVKEAKKPLVTVKTEASPLGKGGERGVKITISDNGPGIPEDIKDKIFQPFFTTKPTGQGTGLGLSMSYDIVKAHGGTLKVDTDTNMGTSFIIELP